MAILSLVGYITAVFVSMYFTQRITLWLHWEHKWAPVVSYIIVFAAIVLAFILLAKLIEKLFSAMELNFMTKIIGGSVGILVVIVIFSAVLWVLQLAHVLTDAQLHESKTAGILIKLAPALYHVAELIFPTLKASLAQFQEYLAKLK